MFTHSNKVEYVKFKCFVSGRKAPIDTMKWNVDGTDLGIPVYSPKENQMWMFFGDSFSTPMPSDQDWRGTVIAKFKNTDLSNGLGFDSFVPDEKGNALGLIIHHASGNEEYYERTKICQGAVEVNGVMYAFYESIRHWGEPGYWDVNYSGAVKSTDGGSTWERVYDLTWAAENGKYRDVVKELAEQDTNLKPSGYNFDIDAHFCPVFGQIYPKYGKDGYVYLYGRRGGRQFGVVVARVKKENIEDFNAYEYWCKIDGKRSWIAGAEGLKQINLHEEESYICPLPVSNFSVTYNEYLEKWLTVYYKPYVGVVYRTGDTPYDDFTDEQLLITQTDHLPGGDNGLYGGFTHELMTGENGKVMYVVCSQWNTKVYCSELFEVRFK